MTVSNSHYRELLRDTEYQRKLARVSDVFRGRAFHYNGLILRILALSSKPLYQLEILRAVKNTENGRGSGTVSNRVRALRDVPKPFIEVVEIRRQRVREVPIYNLTLRGGIAALLLLDKNSNDELVDYAKRVGWSTGDKVLEVLRHLAEDSRFLPTVVRILLRFRTEYESGLVGLDTANDSFISSSLRKNLYDWLSTRPPISDNANDWLHSRGYGNFSDLFPSSLE